MDSLKLIIVPNYTEFSAKNMASSKEQLNNKCLFS